MPLPDGRLTEQDRKKFDDHLKAKGGDRAFPCAFCGTQDWLVGNHIVIDPLPAPGPDGLMPVVPYVVLFCKRCGFSARFNAMMIGLYDRGAVLQDISMSTTPPPAGVRNG